MAAIAEAFLDALSSTQHPLTDEMRAPSPHLRKSKVAAFTNFNVRQQMDFILANYRKANYVADADAAADADRTISASMAQAPGVVVDRQKRIYSAAFLKALRSKYDEKESSKKIEAAREFARSEEFQTFLQRGVATDDDDTDRADDIIGLWRAKGGGDYAIQKKKKSQVKKASGQEEDSAQYDVCYDNTDPKDGAKPTWGVLTHKGGVEYELKANPSGALGEQLYTGTLEDTAILWSDDDIWTRVGAEDGECPVAAVRRELSSRILPHCQQFDDIDEKYQDLCVSSEELTGSLLDMALAEGRAGSIFEVLELILKSDLSLLKPRSLDELTWLAREPTASLPRKDLVIDSAEVSLPSLDSLKFSVACDGQYFYAHCTSGLFKIGTGYHDTQLGKIYARNRTFHTTIPDVSRDGMKCELAACDGKLYFRSPAIEHVCVVVDKATLEESGHISLDGKGTIPTEDLSAFAFLKPGNSRMVAVRDKLAFVTIERASSTPVTLMYSFSPADGFKFSSRHMIRGPAVSTKSSGRGGKANKTADPGGVYGVGGNMCGELGLGNNEVQRAPVKLPFFEDKPRLVQVTGGNQSTYFLTDTGRVYVCGNNGSGQLGIGHQNFVYKTQLIPQSSFGDSPVAKVVSGCFTEHTMFITESQKAYMCGAGHNYALGLEDTNPRLVPTLVKGPLKDKNIVGGGISGTTSCWLTDTGEVWVAGSNDALHNGIKPQVQVPVRLRGSEALNIVDVSFGYMHALYLTESGEVWANGNGNQGQLGNNNQNYQQKAPVRIDFFHKMKIKVKKLSSGYYHCAALAEDNTVYVWGHNGNGALAMDNEGGGNNMVKVPTVPKFFKDMQIADVSCGGFHTIFLTVDNQVYACGQNNYGEVFNEERQPLRVPKKPLALFEDQNVTIIYAGMYHSVVVSENCEDALSEKAYRYGHFHCGLHDLVCVAPPDMRLGYHSERYAPPLRPVRRIIPGMPLSEKELAEREQKLEKKLKERQEKRERRRQRERDRPRNRGNGRGRARRGGPGFGRARGGFGRGRGQVGRGGRPVWRLRAAEESDSSDDEKYGGMKMFADSSDSDCDDGEKKAAKEEEKDPNVVKPEEEETEDAAEAEAEEKGRKARRRIFDKAADELKGLHKALEAEIKEEEDANKAAKPEVDEEDPKAAKPVDEEDPKAAKPEQEEDLKAAKPEEEEDPKAAKPKDEEDLKAAKPKVDEKEDPNKAAKPEDEEDDGSDAGGMLEVGDLFGDDSDDAAADNDEGTLEVGDLFDDDSAADNDEVKVADDADAEEVDAESVKAKIAAARARMLEKLAEAEKQRVDEVQKLAKEIEEARVAAPFDSSDSDSKSDSESDSDSDALGGLFGGNDSASKSDSDSDSDAVGGLFGTGGLFGIGGGDTGGLFGSDDDEESDAALAKLKAERAEKRKRIKALQAEEDDRYSRAVKAYPALEAKLRAEFLASIFNDQRNLHDTDATSLSKPRARRFELKSSNFYHESDVEVTSYIDGIAFTHQKPTFNESRAFLRRAKDLLAADAYVDFVAALERFFRRSKKGGADGDADAERLRAEVRDLLAATPTLVVHLNQSLPPDARLELEVRDLVASEAEGRAKELADAAAFVARVKELLGDELYEEPESVKDSEPASVSESKSESGKDSDVGGAKTEPTSEKAPSESGSDSESKSMECESDSEKKSANGPKADGDKSEPDKGSGAKVEPERKSESDGDISAVNDKPEESTSSALSPSAGESSRPVTKYDAFLEILEQFQRTDISEAKQAEEAEKVVALLGDHVHVFEEFNGILLSGGDDNGVPPYTLKEILEKVEELPPGGDYLADYFRRVSEIKGRIGDKAFLAIEHVVESVDVSGGWAGALRAMDEVVDHMLENHPEVPDMRAEFTEDYLAIHLSEPPKETEVVPTSVIMCHDSHTNSTWSLHSTRPATLGYQPKSEDSKSEGGGLSLSSSSSEAILSQSASITEIFDEANKEDDDAPGTPKPKMHEFYTVDRLKEFPYTSEMSIIHRDFCVSHAHGKVMGPKKAVLTVLSNLELLARGFSIPGEAGGSGRQKSLCVDVRDSALLSLARLLEFCTTKLFSEDGAKGEGDAADMYALMLVRLLRLSMVNTSHYKFTQSHAPSIRMKLRVCPDLEGFTYRVPTAVGHSLNVSRFYSIVTLKTDSSRPVSVEHVGVDQYASDDEKKVPLPPRELEIDAQSGVPFIDVGVQVSECLGGEETFVDVSSFRNHTTPRRIKTIKKVVVVPIKESLDERKITDAAVRRSLNAKGYHYVSHFTEGTVVTLRPKNAQLHTPIDVLVMSVSPKDAIMALETTEVVASASTKVISRADAIAKRDASFHSPAGPMLTKLWDSWSAMVNSTSFAVKSDREWVENLYKIVEHDAKLSAKSGFTIAHPTWDKRCKFLHDGLKYIRANPNPSQQPSIFEMVFKSLASIVGSSRLLFPPTYEEQAHPNSPHEFPTTFPTKFNVDTALDWLRNQNFGMSFREQEDLVEDIGETWALIDLTRNGRVTRDEFRTVCATRDGHLRDVDIESFFGSLAGSAHEATHIGDPINGVEGSGDVKGASKTVVTFWDFAVAVFHLRNVRLVPPYHQLGSGTAYGELDEIHKDDSTMGLLRDNEIFVPETARHTLTLLLEFVESHIDGVLDSVDRGEIDSDSDGTDVECSSSELQKGAVELLKHMILDLSARFTKRNYMFGQLRPMAVLVVRIFARAIDILKRIAAANSILTKDKALSFDAMETLHPVLERILPEVHTLTTLIPEVVHFAVPMISSWWDYAPEMGLLCRTLVTHLNGLNRLVNGSHFGDSATNSGGNVDNFVSFVLESEHPYKTDAEEEDHEIAFPEEIEFMVVEFDSRSTTVQAEDYIQMFSGDGNCIAVSQRLFGNESMPDRVWTSALLVPSNRAVLKFAHATDYNERKDPRHRWGFRCEVKGYLRPRLSDKCEGKSWLVDLQKKLTYLGGVCASQLITGQRPNMWKGVTCPRQCKMVYFRTHNDGFICDMCKKSFPVDVDMKGCRTCDFDTCKECYKGKSHEARLASSPLCEQGLSSQYLSGGDKFVPRTVADKFLEALLDDDFEAASTTSSSTTDGGRNTSADELPLTSSQRLSRTLVDSMRRAKGEPADGILAGEGTYRAMAGIPSAIKLVLVDEFEVRVAAGGAFVEVRVHKGSVDVVAGTAPDFFEGVECERLADVGMPDGFSQSCAAASVNGDKIYLFGGVLIRNQVAHVYEYDVAAGTVAKKCPLPQGNLKCAEVFTLTDGRLLVVGGNYPQPKLNFYDPTTDTFEEKDMPRDFGWGSQVCMGPVGIIHVLGGLNLRQKYYTYDVAADTWTVMPDIEGQGRFSGGAAADSFGNVYLFGGAVRHRVGKSMTMFDAESREWTKAPDMPEALSRFACSYNENGIVVCGGGSQYGNDQEPSNDHVWLFSFESKEWKVSESKLPDRIRESASCMIGDTVYVFGGVRDYAKQQSVFAVRAVGGGGGGGGAPAASRSRSEVDYEVTVTDCKDGSYNIVYEVEESCVVHVEVLVNGHPVSVSPLRVEVASAMPTTLELGPLEETAFGIVDHSKASVDASSSRLSIEAPQKRTNDELEIQVDEPTDSDDGEGKMSPISDDFGTAVLSSRAPSDVVEQTRKKASSALSPPPTSKKASALSPPPTSALSPASDAVEGVDISAVLPTLKPSAAASIPRTANNIVDHRLHFGSVRQDEHYTVYNLNEWWKRDEIALSAYSTTVLPVKFEEKCEAPPDVITMQAQFGTRHKIDENAQFIVRGMDKSLKTVRVVYKNVVPDDIHACGSVFCDGSCDVARSRCNNGHDLTEFTTHHNSFCCDGCRKTMKKDEKMFGCRPCDFDFCPKCYVPEEELDTPVIHADFCEGGVFAAPHSKSVTLYRERRRKDPTPIARVVLRELKASNGADPEKLLAVVRASKSVFVYEGCSVDFARLRDDESKEPACELQCVRLYNDHGMRVWFGRTDPEVTQFSMDTSAASDLPRRKANQVDKFVLPPALPLAKDLLKSDDGSSEEKEAKSKENIKEVEKEDDPFKMDSFPEWYTTMRDLSPGVPPKLYAYAYRQAEKKIDEAVNWLMDDGQRFMSANAEIFAEESAELAVEWNCPKCTLENAPELFKCGLCDADREVKVPSFLHDDHPFWEDKDTGFDGKKKKKKGKRGKRNKGADKENDKGDDGDAAEQIKVHFGDKEVVCKASVMCRKPYLRPPNDYRVFLDPPKGGPLPLANTPYSRKAMRAAFAAILRHHGLVPLAITCAEFLEKSHVNAPSPLLPKIGEVWNIASRLSTDFAKALEGELKKNKKKNGNDGEKPKAEENAVEEEQKDEDKEDGANKKKDEKKAAAKEKSLLDIIREQEEEEAKAKEMEAAKEDEESKDPAPTASREDSVGAGEDTGAGAKSSASPPLRPPTMTRKRKRTLFNMSSELNEDEDDYADMAKKFVDRARVLLMLAPRTLSSLDDLRASSSSPLGSVSSPRNVLSPTATSRTSSPSTAAAGTSSAGLLPLPIQAPDFRRSISHHVDDLLSPTTKSKSSSSSSTDSNSSHSQQPKGSSVDNTPSLDRVWSPTSLLLQRSSSDVEVLSPASGRSSHHRPRGDDSLLPPAPPSGPPTLGSSASYLVAGDASITRSGSSGPLSLSRNSNGSLRRSRFGHRRTPSSSAQSVLRRMMPPARVSKRPSDKKRGGGGGGGGGGDLKFIHHSGPVHFFAFPDNIDSHPITKLICDHLINGTSNDNDGIRKCLLNRREIARARVRGFRMFESLLASTDSLSIKQDLVWLASASMKSCITVPHLKNTPKSDRDSIHYSHGLEGCGPQLQLFTQMTFTSLYSALSQLFRRDTRGPRSSYHLKSVLLDAWSLDFKPTDYTFLHDSRIFPIIRSLMARGPASSPTGSPRIVGGAGPPASSPASSPRITGGAGPTSSPTGSPRITSATVTSPRGTVSSPKVSALVPAGNGSPRTPKVSALEPASEDTNGSKSDEFDSDAGDNTGRLSASALESLMYTLACEKECTDGVEIKASTGERRVRGMLDRATDTYWQSSFNQEEFGYNMRHTNHTLLLTFPEERRLTSIVWHVDKERDRENMPKTVEVSVGTDADSLEVVGEVEVANETAWFKFAMKNLTDGSKFRPDKDGAIEAKCFYFDIKDLWNNGYEARIRQLVAFTVGDEPVRHPVETARDYAGRLRERGLELFRKLVGRSFIHGPVKSRGSHLLKPSSKSKSSDLPLPIDEQSELKDGGDEIAKTKDGAKKEDKAGDDVNGLAPPAPLLKRQKSSEDLQQQVVGLLFDDRSASRPDTPEGAHLDQLQRLVFELIFNEIANEVHALQTGEHGDFLVFANHEKLLEKQKEEEMNEKIRRQLHGDEEKKGDEKEDDEKDSRSRPKLTVENTQSDVYSFELVSMIGNLSVSRNGQRFIGSPLFVGNLFAMFVSGSARVQRQLLAVFRRVLPHLRPEVLSIGTDVHTQTGNASFSDPIRFFLLNIASGLAGQVRGWRDGKKYTETTNLKSWRCPIPAEIMLPCVTLLRYLVKLSGSVWRHAIIETVTSCVAKLSGLKSEDLGDNQDFWLAVAGLCVVAGSAQSTPLLGEKAFNFSKFDNLSVDSSSSGSCRVKTSRDNGTVQIIVVGDISQLKAVAEFRQVHGSENVCRFCERQLKPEVTAPNPPSEALENCCNSQDCIDARDAMCRKFLPCGHPCAGIKDEEECLSCLHPDCDEHKGIQEDLDTLCNICYTDNLGAQPTIQLECGHAFHFFCVRKLLELRWNGARITFKFRCCPLCRRVMKHPGIMDLADPIDVLYEQVKKKANTRLAFERLEKHPDIIVEGAPFYKDPTGFAMHKFAYYLCYTCKKPYYGGDYACAAAGGGGNFDPTELMCGGCSPINAEDCAKHGKDYLEFKCRYCCSVAVWFCFGTTHFCEPCHNNHGTLTSKKKEDLVPCPCKPRDQNRLPEKLDQENCPLGVDHPPHGEEFALGCGLCRNVQTF